jgi:site-specific recombinase XerD
MTKEQEVQMNNYYLELLKKGSINTLNEAMIFKLSYEKAFSLNSVSQQREQLNGFRKWTSERANNEDVVKQEVIDDYLKTI